MRRYVLLLVLILLTGCNLETSESVTPTFEPLPTTSYVPPTPYRAPTGVTNAQGFNAQNAGATPTNGNLLTPVPAQTLLQQPQPPASQQNVIEAFVNNLIVPVWNFVYTLVLTGVSTMWLFAGARGGVFAQLFCCVAPAVVIVGVVLFRLRIIRRR